jgi:hypothetical protein
MRQRGERIERSFAHLYDTGGMRRTHLRGHTNILKRVLIHASSFNLGLIMRQLIGLGTPRGLQGRAAVAIATLLVLVGVGRRRFAAIVLQYPLLAALWDRLRQRTLIVDPSAAATCVAVGTTVARRPPHRTVRAGLLHTAPTLDE